MCSLDETSHAGFLMCWCVIAHVFAVFDVSSIYEVRSRSVIAALVHALTLMWWRFASALMRCHIDVSWIFVPCFISLMEDWEYVRKDSLHERVPDEGARTPGGVAREPCAGDEGRGLGRIESGHRLGDAALEDGRDQAARIMRELGIRGVGTAGGRPPRSPPGAGAGRLDLVERKFEASAPNRLHVADAGMLQSTGTVGDSYDNALAERANNT